MTRTIPRFCANSSTAVLAVEPAATGPAVMIYEAGNTIVRAFIEAGIFALAAIFVLLWITLRRLSDVLMTLVPLLLAAVVTLEMCVVLDLPLNFANIIALPLLLGVGVAFKIYYIMAWRRGRTALVQSTLSRAVIFSADDHRHRLRQPVAVRPSRHLQHGRIDGSGADLHDDGGGAIPAGADGAAAQKSPPTGRGWRDLPAALGDAAEFPGAAAWGVERANRRAQRSRRRTRCAVPEPRARDGVR